jgi:RES domain-containing protein
MTEPEPGVQELFEAIAACLQLAVPFQGVVMRSAGMKHATAKDFASGAGASAKGGRWNPRGIQTIYASTTPATAAYESYQSFSDFGFSPSSIRPRVFCGAEVLLQALLDMTDGGIRRRLGFTLEEILNEDWQTIQREGDESWTQAAGRGAYQAGFEGLLVPSARHRPGGTNIVVFPENLRTDSRIDLLGRDDLPDHPQPP